MEKCQSVPSQKVLLLILLTRKKYAPPQKNVTDHSL